MNWLAELTAYKAEKARITRAEKNLEDWKARIIDAMRAEGRDVVDMTSVKAVLSEREKNWLDEKLIRAELPEVAEKYNRVTRYPRLDVK